jgi:CYTH domain-containing protein
LTRPEFEYRIPQADAVYLLDHLCSGPLIEKTRYLIEHAGHSWEVDEFHGENAGLVVAEIELRDPGEQIDLPDWIDREVTGDPRYYNANLASHPYKNWRS